ncbi:MAG: succinate dehydrogenase, hydrophobic membrane anchor protein [Pseudomonadota bacterium]
MSLRTPLKQVRRLGSAKEGADHFWKQRVTAVANLFLGVALVWIVAQTWGATHAEAAALIANPFVALALLLLVLSGTLHMRLGMQVVIEDYVSNEGFKIALLILNTFFAIVIGLACVYAILKLSFGA